MTNHPKSSDKDGAAVRFPAPLAFFVMIAMGIALQKLWAIPFPLPASVLRTAALVSVFAGSALLFGAFGQFWRSGQDPLPWRPTPEVLSRGLYAYTRNPMYVGMAFLQAAAAFHRANVWVLILLPASLALVYVTAVRQEEAYLERKFGDQYRAYKRSVRRWL